MNIIRILSDWFSRTFRINKTNPINNIKIKNASFDLLDDTPYNKVKPISIDEKRNNRFYRDIQDIPYQEYVNKLNILKENLEGMPLWRAVVSLYYDQKQDPSKMIYSGDIITPEERKQRDEKIAAAIKTVKARSTWMQPTRTPEQTAQEKFQDDFREWLREEKDVLMKSATPELFVEFLKAEKGITNEMLDHIRVSAHWINGIFVNHRDWDKEVKAVQKFLAAKHLTLGKE